MGVPRPFWKDATTTYLSASNRPVASTAGSHRSGLPPGIVSFCNHRGSGHHTWWGCLFHRPQTQEGLPPLQTPDSSRFPDLAGFLSCSCRAGRTPTSVHRLVQNFSWLRHLCLSARSHSRACSSIFLSCGPLGCLSCSEGLFWLPGTQQPALRRLLQGIPLQDPLAHTGDKPPHSSNPPSSH